MLKLVRVAEMIGMVRTSWPLLAEPGLPTVTSAICSVAAMATPLGSSGSSGSCNCNSNSVPSRVPWTSRLCSNPIRAVRNSRKVPPLLNTEGGASVSSTPVIRPSKIATSWLGSTSVTLRLAL